MVERLKCGLKAPRVIRGFRNNRVAEGALRSQHVHFLILSGTSA